MIQFLRVTTHLLVLNLFFIVGEGFLLPSTQIYHQNDAAATKRRKYASSPSTSFDIDQIELMSGVSVEVISRLPSDIDKNKPPMVMIHGSFHSAWCWTEHWIDYFVDLGYPIMAISLRGTGGTFAGIGVKKVKIDEHAADIRAFLKEVDQLLLLKTKKDTQIRLMKPVIVSHSFGGAAVTKYMETYPDELSQMSATIFLCSVPPSGNGDMTIRFLRRSLVRAWKITAGFAMKKSIVDADLCRDLFFGGPKIELEEKQEDGTVVTAVEDYGVSDEDIERYQGYFKRDTVATLDVSDFVKRLPSKQWVDGCAPFLSRLPPCLVVGATRDFIVDQEGVEETAKYFGVSPLLVDSPHDIMIGANWKRGADEIYKWLQENGL